METSLVAQMVKNLPAMQETWVRSLSWEDPVEKEMASHFSIVAWKILGPQEPGGLQFMATVHHKKIGHDLVTKQ